MECNTSIGWQFSGSEAAKDASAASLGAYSSKLFGLCDPEGKPILPPRSDHDVTSEAAENAVVKAIKSGAGNAYAPSNGLPAAKIAVAEYLNRDLPHKLTKDDVFMTAGCKQAIELAVDILAKPNANVLLPKPGFPWDVVRSIYNKLEVRNYGFLPEKDYEIDINSVEKAINQNTFAIFIINPHNPNGNTYSETNLKELAVLAQTKGIMVVSVEEFRWTVFGNNSFVPMGKFSSTVPVITLGSISKGWSVPGWQTGWLALHDHDGVFKSNKILEAANEFMVINSKPATVIQAAIPTILEKTPTDFFERRKTFLRQNAEIAFSKLNELHCLTAYMKPEACTFLWTKLDFLGFKDIKDDEDFCERLAAEENLVLLPGIAFGQKGWARHSIDMETKQLYDAFERLVTFCARHSINK